MRYRGKRFPGQWPARMLLAAAPAMLLVAAGMARAAPPPASPPPDRKLLEVTLTVVTPDQDINRTVAQTITLAAPHGVADGIRPVVAGKSSPAHSGKPAVKTAKKTRESLLQARRETAEAKAEAAEAKSEAREDAHNSTTPDSDDGGGG